MRGTLFRLFDIGAPSYFILLLTGFILATIIGCLWARRIGEDADVMVDLFISLWDAAALKPVIEGAGGHYSDWKGLPSVHSGNAVATNRQLAGVVLELTQSA